ncbi:MAG TPA: hypothetical protein VFM25_07385 [Verrucomicrobiae bacterium]|nr:hypothetical protein [Verrucomicrobiae bacterium]
MIDAFNLWGFLAVPVGVLLCFGPGLVAWLIAEYIRPTSEKPENKR